MGTISDRTWSDILAALRTCHPELVRPWFNAVQPVEMRNGTLAVCTPGAAQHQYLTQHCQGAINEAAQAAMQISVSSQQQMAGVDQVASAMENIKQTSAQNASSAKQVEAAAHNLHDLAQKLKTLLE